MIFWIRVWQFVSHHWCATSWFLIPCFLTSNWCEFLHEPTLGCLVYMWFFMELLMAFPNCLIISPLFVQNVDFCDTWCHLFCEILIHYWMDMKFYVWLLDILRFIMVLIPFISHMLSLIYDLLKLVHVWLTSLSMFELALPFWFSFPYFPWSNWAEIWCAYHVMDDVLSWIIWEFFWIVCDWIWVESFCWLLWGSICHALT